MRVPGKSVFALSSLPIALHETRARLQQPPTKHDRLPEQVTPVTLALFRVDARKIDGVSNLLGADNVDGFGLSLVDRLSQSTLIKKLGLPIELSDQAQPSSDRVRFLNRLKRKMVELEVVVVRIATGQ